MLVEGQIAGGFAQGMGGALLEEFLYDERGEPLSVNFADYLMPTAREVPAVDVLITRGRAEPAQSARPQRRGRRRHQRGRRGDRGGDRRCHRRAGRDHAAAGHAAAAACNSQARRPRIGLRCSARFARNPSHGYVCGMRRVASGLRVAWRSVSPGTREWGAHPTRAKSAARVANRWPSSPIHNVKQRSVLRSRGAFLRAGFVRFYLHPKPETEGRAERREAPNFSCLTPFGGVARFVPSGTRPPLDAPPWRFWAGGRASVSGIASGDAFRTASSQRRS